MKLFFSFFSLLSYLCTYSQAQSPDDLLIELSENGCNGNLRVMKAIADDLYFQLESNEQQSIKNTLESEIAINSKSIKILSDKYKNAVEKGDISLAILKGNNALIKGVVSFSTRASGAGILVSGIIETIVDRSLAKVEGIAQKNIEKKNTALLQGGLQELYKKDLQTFKKVKNDLKDGYNEATGEFKKGVVEKSLNLITGNNKEFDEIFKNAKLQDRDLILKNMNERLRTAFIKSEIDQLATDENQDINIAENASRIIKFRNDLSDYMDETSKAIGDLQESQERINKNLNELSERTDLIQKDVDFIKGFMYEKMSPSEKIMAIKSGMITLDNGREEIELKKLKLLQDQELFLKNASFFLQESQALTSIISDLGISGDGVEVLSEAVRIGSAGFEAYNNLQKGNYISAAASVSGLFRQKNDPDAERFKVMTRMIKEVLANQAVMNIKLDSLIIGQRKIIQIQAETLRTLISVSEKIDRNHDAVTKQLQGIETQILINRKLFFEIHKELPFKEIDDYLHEDLKYYISIDSSLSYSQVSDYFDRITIQRFQTDYNDFIGKYFSEKLSDPKSLSINRLYRSFPEDVESSIQGQLASIAYQYSLNKYLLNKFLESDNTLSIKKLISALYLPSKSTQFIDQKIEIETSALSPSPSLSYYEYELLGSNPSDIKNQVNSTLIVPGSVIQMAGLLMDMGVLLPYLNKDFEKASLKEVIEGEKTRVYLGSYSSDLEEALFLVEVSILQQVLLSGDILIPLLYKVLDKGLNYQNSDVYKNNTLAILSLDALNNNPLLRFNFINYFLRKRIVENSSSFASYHLASTIPLKDDLSSVLGTTSDSRNLNKPFIDLSFNDNEGSWFINLKNSKIQLPSADELLEDNYLHSPELVPLFQVREKIINEMLNLNFIQPDNEKDLVFWSILNSLN